MSPSVSEPLPLLDEPPPRIALAMILRRRARACGVGAIHRYSLNRFFAIWALICFSFLCGPMPGRRFLILSAASFEIFSTVSSLPRSRRMSCFWPGVYLPPLEEEDDVPVRATRFPFLSILYFDVS